MFHNIVQVIPYEDYSVYVYFDDGKIVCYDAAPLLNRPVFAPLKDKNTFLNTCTILNDTLAWDIGGNRDVSKCMAIDPDMLYELDAVSEKLAQYRQLISDVRNSYADRHGELKWCDDCEEINLWTYWQGRGHLNARVMLVGQDWGNPSQAPAVMQNIRAMKNGTVADCYMQGNENPTDKNLIRLFQSIGFDIMQDQPQLFFTNFVLGYRTKGISGNFRASWAAADASYFCRLTEIIRPRVMLCLGKDTLRAVLRYFNRPMPEYKSYNQLIESER